MGGRTTVYNHNLTSEWENVRPDNRQFVTDYLRYCRSNDKSKQTIHQYEEWLKVFFCWNYNENDDKKFIDLKKRDFVYYFGWCRDKGMSANRIAALKSVLSSLSNEIELLYEDEYPHFKNQLRSLEPVHITTVREKTVLSAEEVKNILNILVQKHSYQTACYVALACACGARKAELIQMECDFFIPENEVFDGYMYKTGKIRTKGRGTQGKKLQKFVIKEMFKPYFDLWMKQREELGINSKYLFVTKRENGYEQATISTANSMAATVSRLCGVDFYSHSLRHFFATLLKRKNFPDDIIVQIFGWESSEMLKIYSDITPEEVMDSFFKNFNTEVKGE